MHERCRKERCTRSREGMHAACSDVHIPRGTPNYQERRIPQERIIAYAGLCCCRVLLCVVAGSYRAMRWRCAAANEANKAPDKANKAAAYYKANKANKAARAIGGAFGRRDVLVGGWGAGGGGAGADAQGRRYGHGAEEGEGGCEAMRAWDTYARNSLIPDEVRDDTCLRDADFA